MLTINTMRTYQPIWEQIKKYKTATVKAPNFRHKTIIQAVRKERSIDTAYNNMLKTNYIQVRLTPISYPDKEVIVFTLTKLLTISIKDL